MERSVWIRRCRHCGEDDLDVAGGQPALLECEEGRWRCTGCGGTAWEAAGMRFPDDPAGLPAACPFAAVHQR